VQTDTSSAALTGSGSILRRAVIVLVWIAFLAMALELVFRLVVFPDYRALQQDMYVRHPIYTHFNKPNLDVRRFNPMNYDVINHTNSRGFRGLEKNMARELDGLWVIGDSNVFGGYVADNEIFSDRLKNSDLWAANLASEGHTLVNQILVVRDEVRRGGHPKAVILGVSFFNVIQDYDGAYGNIRDPLPNAVSPSPEAITVRAQLKAAAFGLIDRLPRSAMSLRAQLLQTSAIYGWLKVALVGIPALRQWTLDVGLRADVDLVFKNDINILKPLTADNPVTDNIRSTADYIAAVGAWVHDNLNVPFGVVLLPNHQQIYPDKFARLQRHLQMQGQDVDPVRSLRALEDGLNRRNIAVLNALNPLVESREQNLTFPDDGHLTGEGHRIVAAALAAWIKSRLKIDSAP